MYKIEVADGTEEKLAKIGVRNSSNATKNAYPNMPELSKGESWVEHNARFKGEKIKEI